MALEAIPGSVSTPGNLRIAFVPSGNPLSVTVLTADTTKDLTYSLTPDGFNRTIGQDTIDDPRLTLLQKLSKPGGVTETLEITWVYGTDDDVARVALAPNTTGFIIARYAVPNETAWTAAQVVDKLTIQAGQPRKNAPADNGVFTATQTIFLTAPTEYDAVLAA